MHYYEIWVSSAKFHGDAPLTYSSSRNMTEGTLVIVPLQRQTVSGVVLKEVARPRFATKEIVRVVSATSLPRPLLKLLPWLASYYPAPLGQLTTLIAPPNLTVQTRPSDSPKNALTREEMPTLTLEQTKAVERIQQAHPQNILLHGDTGTGKTRVYLELVAAQFKAGRSSIILTPEIGLTPQLALAASQAFPERTVILHSELSPATKRRAWLQILEATDPLIVIGPRSALFAPLKNVGLIVIDEFHDGSYKQEQAPHYLTSRVAAKLAELHQAQLILGSATPLVADYFAFSKKGLPIVRMKEPAIRLGSQDTDIRVVDLRQRQRFTRSQWLNDELIDGIKEALQRNEQALIFLNRRGTARLTLCQSCGWQALCPRCDLPLTYHGDRHVMQCHTCGWQASVPLACPSCGATNLEFKSVGTKSLVNELERLFPGARIKRFDSDNAKSDRLEHHYTAIKEGAIDILVGTQVLGKGLDLPRLSLVGIVLADTSLTFPDYTSAERTFQLIGQVLGRINRGHLPGTAFIQTFDPPSTLLQATIAKDYEMFYQEQLQERQMYGFPPFRYLLKLTCTRATRASAKQASQTLTNKLRRTKAIEVIGPSPSFIEKVRDKYRWQVVVKASSRDNLVEIVKSLPANWSYDIDPMNLL